MKNKNGELLTDSNDITTKWKEHFEELLNIEENATTDNGEGDEEIDIESNQENEEDVTEEELTRAINKIKNGKSAGHDRITAEMIKCLGTQGRIILLKLHNLVFSKARIPKNSGKRR